MNVLLSPVHLLTAIHCIYGSDAALRHCVLVSCKPLSRLVKAKLIMYELNRSSDQIPTESLDFSLKCELRSLLHV